MLYEPKPFQLPETCPMVGILSIVIRVPCGLSKNVHSLVTGWRVSYMSIRSFP